MPEPTERQLQLASRRAVCREDAREVLRATVATVITQFRQAQADYLGNGGVIRGLPMNADGHVPLSNEESPQDVFAKFAYEQLTGELLAAGTAWSETEIDWSEVERLSEIP